MLILKMACVVKAACIVHYEAVNSQKEGRGFLYILGNKGRYEAKPDREAGSSRPLTLS